MIIVKLLSFGVVSYAALLSITDSLCIFKICFIKQLMNNTFSYCRNRQPPFSYLIRVKVQVTVDILLVA